MHKFSNSFTAPKNALAPSVPTMAKIVLSSLIFLLLSGGLYAQTIMSSQEATALETQVKKRAQTTQTITSDFVQYKHLDFLANDIQSQGKLAFKSPDLVKWEYNKPFEYSVIFKGGMLYINNEGKKNNVDLGSSQMLEQMNKLITKSIKGDMFDTSEFSISYYKNNGESEVHFAPKNPEISDFIKAFHISFSNEGEVLSVKMLEPSDDYTKIVFSNRKTNNTLLDAVFSN